MTPILDILAGVCGASLFGYTLVIVIKDLIEFHKGGDKDDHN